VGTQFILPSIAAVVIGGTSLAGGRGGVIGTLIGAFILNQIADVIFLVGLSSYWQQVASGLILVGVVLLAPLLEAAAERGRQGRGRLT
jgi:ribose transport system permease protein